MLSVAKICCIMLNVIMMNVMYANAKCQLVLSVPNKPSMLNVVMLSVVALSVVAPLETPTLLVVLL